MSLFTEFSNKLEQTEDQAEIQAGGSFEAIRASYLTALREKALEMQNDGNFDLNEVDIRFSTALNLSKVRNALVAIIGAGGLGNWQWRILAAMGFRRIAIYDDDNVGIENVGPQAHSIFDLDLPKTEAVENAALIYRGIKIIGRNKRVYSYKDICDDLGEKPDIVIGCTDSAEFRNRFIEQLVTDISVPSFEHSQKPVPDLFIDYRMSLGDWVAYIIPARALRNIPRPMLVTFTSWYRSVAVFSEDQAVQEPCTERAIAYTGANVASFTGALLHWFYSGGRTEFHNQEYMLKFLSGNTAMPARKVSFSSRDFEFITDTAREKKLSARIKKLQDDAMLPWELIRAAFHLPKGSELVDSGWELEADFYAKYKGKMIVLPGSGDVFLCGHNCCLDVVFEDDGDEDEPEPALQITGFDRRTEPNRLQPFMVYELPEYLVKDYVTLQILGARTGDIFRLDNDCRKYVRIGEDMIERLVRSNYDNQWEYSRMGWDSNYEDWYLLGKIQSDEIEGRFNELAAEYDSENESRDAEERQSGRAPMAAADLRSGQVISINDEVLEIVSVGASNFQVRDENGEMINYSLRRMPEVFLVSE